ncbi:MAG: hypothetical protein ACK5Y2_11760 [Bdellovibrionales bacterium]
MKTSFAILSSVLLAASLSFAAGQRKDKAKPEAQGDSKVETSTNPVTGTQTTTESYEHKSGRQSVEAEQKTKLKKDGQVSKETDIEAESKSK